MGDECYQQFNLGNFVFDEENHEQKSRKFFGSTFNRSLLFFYVPNFSVIVLIQASAVVRIILYSTWEETTV